MPSIGEQGWGTLINGNFTTIDATMKSFDDVLSKMTWDGDNVTFPGNITALSGGIGTHYTVTQGDKPISLRYTSYGNVPHHFDLITDMNNTYSGTVTVSHHGENGNHYGIHLYAYNPKTGYINSTKTNSSGTVWVSATLTFENACIVTFNASNVGDSTSSGATVSFNNIILTPSE